MAKLQYQLSWQEQIILTLCPLKVSRRISVFNWKEWIKVFVFKNLNDLTVNQILGYWEAYVKKKKFEGDE